MISKEPIHRTAEPAELPDTLKLALQEAYPDPKGQIAARVMEQIRLEREEAEQKRRSDAAQRLRRRQGLIMKYGGMAACMVILSGALVIAAPHMDRNAAMDCAAENAAVTEAAAYDDADAAPQTVLYMADEASAGAYRVEAYSGEAEETPSAACSDEEAEAEGTARLTASYSQSKAAEIETEIEAEIEAEPTAASTMAKMLSDSSIEPEAAEEAAISEEAEASAQEQYDSRFVLYLIENGYLTEPEYRRWNVEREADAPWTPEELCSAFGIDPLVYDEFVSRN